MTQIDPIMECDERKSVICDNCTPVLAGMIEMSV